MRIHHLNCGTMCPVAARWINGRGGVFEAGKMICHCLLVESPDGLVLVDTGYGIQDVAEGARRLPALVLAATRPVLDRAECAVERIRALGFEPDDVRDIVVTHLDLDHAGGLGDFPRARVHVFATEHEAAHARGSFSEKRRYLPAHWAHGPRWVLHETRGETWHGFEAVRAVEALDGDMLIVPVVGHSRGHSAIALRTDEGWLLHCGDAYFHHGEVSSPPYCPPLLAGFQRVVAFDNAARLRNRDRLQQLAITESARVRLFSAHDPDEFAAFAHA